MKCEVIIDENTEPKVVIYAKQKTSLVNEIERLCADDDIAIVGSDGNDSVLLEVAQISCFVVENDKVLAITSDGRYQIKGRLYQVEQMLSDNFVKINQSCIANIKMIKRFDASVSGQLIGGLGPIIFGIICLIHENISDEFYISGKEIFWAIISIYALAFIQAGASVFNQIEEWSQLKCTTFHFLTLYLAYMICYIFNSFLPFKAEILILFTIIFVIVYFAVWTVVVISIKLVSKKMNKKLGDMEK